MSRQLDNEGVDFIGTGPFHIQAKMVQGSVPYYNILESMPKDLMPVIIHGKTRKEPIVIYRYDDLIGRELPSAPKIESIAIMSGKRMSNLWEALDGNDLVSVSLKDRPRLHVIKLNTFLQWLKELA